MKIACDAAHNSHNCPESARESNSVNCVDGLGRAEKLLAELRALGVILSINADGRLAFDAPAGAIGDELLCRMRAERDGLLAALAEPTGPEYLTPMPGVICPWCSSDKHLLEHAEGLRCDQCGRDAFQFGGGSIVRADWVELIEVDWPVNAEQTAVTEPAKPAKDECGESLQTAIVFDS